MWTLVFVAALAACLLRYAQFGRYLFAVGSNERTARLCGVPVQLVKIGVYTLAGALAGLAGIMEFADADRGRSHRLDWPRAGGHRRSGHRRSVANGGEGSIMGSVIGALLMTVIKTGCTHLGLANWVEEVVTGIIIVVAVALDRLRHRRE